jgi:hypothetical protein
MDGNIKVGKVSMTALVEKNIVWLDIPVRAAGVAPK